MKEVKLEIAWDVDDDTTEEELREELKEYLNKHHISRSEQSDILNAFDTWAETAQLSDTFVYDGNKYAHGKR